MKTIDEDPESHIIQIVIDDNGTIVTLDDCPTEAIVEIALLEGFQPYIGRCPHCGSTIISLQPGTRKCVTTLPDGHPCGATVHLAPTIIDVANEGLA